MVLGIDTSCYTTSVALAQDGRIIAQERRLLTVSEGERGLMQSEGVFQHVRRLPDLIERVMAQANGAKLIGVCASVRPRPQPDSYMPVFNVGAGFGRGIAACLGVPFIETTHQQGHIRAALVDTRLLPGDTFLALHLSGGTTEILCVKNGEGELIGGSNDLHAGQFVDRVGVRLGLGFPAGPELEKMARQGQARAMLPVWVRGCDCSFSGCESAAQRLIDAGDMTPEDVAAEVFSCVARTIAKMLLGAWEKTGVKRFLLAGGVASSSFLRGLITERVQKKCASLELNWGRPELSGDNACGPALIGWEKIFVND